MSLIKHISFSSTLAPALIILVSCNRLPEPDFTWGPEDNPEAGAVIWFANRTPEASFYEWHFGDGVRSDLENPTHIFPEPGTYDIELSAYNDAGSQTKIRTITINDPTVLVFTITDSSGTIPLAGAELRVYDNQDDWDNVNKPLLVAYANSEGQVEFSNLGPIVYYLWAFRNEAGGIWISGGYTPALTLNQVNSFPVSCQWFPYEEKKAVRSGSFIGQELGRTD
jgi:hypothetical protein